MKILLVGDWHSNLHEEPLKHAFLDLGHEVIGFSWHVYFQKPTSNMVSRFFQKAQNKFTTGPIINRLNLDLISIAQKNKPDCVFIYRGTHILPSTLKKLKTFVPVLMGYNNDDPFSPQYPFWVWRHFLKGVPHYDMMYAYRLHNISDFSEAGAKKVALLRSWFVPAYNYPIELSSVEKEQYACDVVFIGHYEDDGRLDYLTRLIQDGVKLKIFGPNGSWDHVTSQHPLLKTYHPVKSVRGTNYNLALNGAKIALCFLSKLNRDTYTRRCFEIPATKTLMLSEYTEDLAGLFKAGEEADFFHSIDQLSAKTKLYLSDDKLREKVAEGGFNNVHTHGHDVTSRAKMVCNHMNELLHA